MSYQSERAINGAVGAHVKWSRTTDRSAATAPARQAFNAKFLKEADPDGTLPTEERSRIAGHLRRAYFLRMTAASVKARRQRAAAHRG